VDVGAASRPSGLSAIAGVSLDPFAISEAAAASVPGAVHALPAARVAAKAAVLRRDVATSARGVPARLTGSRSPPCRAASAAWASFGPWIILLGG